MTKYNQNHTQLNRIIEHSYLNHKKHIHTVIYKLSQNHELARDVVQQTYLNSIISNNQLNLTKSNLISSARNIFYKQEESHNHISFDTIDQSIELHYSNFNGIGTEITISKTLPAFKKLQLTIERSLNSISTTIKELLILYFIENLSIVDIARITQRSIIDIKVNLHHSIIIFEMVLHNNMKGKLVTTTEHCPIYSKKCEHLFYSRTEIPKKLLNKINFHISNCCECLDNNKQLKIIGIILNFIPIIKAAPSLEESVSLNLKRIKQLKYCNLNYPHSINLLH